MSSRLSRGIPRSTSPTTGVSSDAFTNLDDGQEVIPSLIVKNDIRREDKKYSYHREHAHARSSSAPPEKKNMVVLFDKLLFIIWPNRKTVLLLMFIAIFLLMLTTLHIHQTSVKGNIGIRKQSNNRYLNYYFLWLSMFMSTIFDYSGFFKHKYKFNACIMTRVQNIPYLIPEWIQYHYLIGFNHIYISDDCSTDNKTVPLLHHYHKTGLISFYPHLPFLNCSYHVPDENSHFRYLSSIAKDQCKWLAMMDIDEFIFPTNTPFKIDFLPDILASSESQGLLRMLSYNIGSHGLEKRSEDCIISTYYYGMLDVHIKTMALTEVVLDWGFTHHPVLFKQSFIESKNNIIRFFAYHPFHHPWETQTINGCVVPVSPIYIRHYKTLSWEDFQMIRVPRARTGGNDMNLYRINPRKEWLNYNWTEPKCHVPGEEYRKQIGPLFSSKCNSLYKQDFKSGYYSNHTPNISLQRLNDSAYVFKTHIGGPISTLFH
mmetsp:Transcript_5459/g.5622  ORF Transcript_5459/g.5622 Transcript_5459/m.5622 type:complete len:486 (-) Transcript_5459:298-1755(-)